MFTVDAPCDVMADFPNASIAVYISWAMLTMIKSSMRRRLGLPKGCDKR